MPARAEVCVGAPPLSLALMVVNISGGVVCCRGLACSLLACPGLYMRFFLTLIRSEFKTVQFELLTCQQVGKRAGRALLGHCGFIAGHSSPLG